MSESPDQAVILFSTFNLYKCFLVCLHTLLYTHKLLCSTVHHSNALDIMQSIEGSQKYIYNVYMIINSPFSISSDFCLDTRWHLANKYSAEIPSKSVRGRLQCTTKKKTHRITNIWASKESWFVTSNLHQMPMTFYIKCESNFLDPSRQQKTE